MDSLIKNLQELRDIAADDEKLRQSFEETYKRLNANGMGERMNETTTIIIERLANLRMGSMIIVASKDEPGVLRDLSTIFAECGINLTAIDSHIVEEGVKFMIGEDTSTSDEALAQAKIRLSEKGFKVEQVKRKQ